MVESAYVRILASASCKTQSSGHARAIVLDIRKVGGSHASVSETKHLANRRESGDALGRWFSCSDCFVARSLGCCGPPHGVKRRSWFFATRSMC